MAIRSNILEYDPEVDGRVTIRFHKDLHDGEVIASATAKIQVRATEDPEDWDDVSGVTVTATVVDAYKDDGTTLIAADQAVQVEITDADADAETPTRGGGEAYRVYVEATVTGRSVPLVAKNPIRFRP